MMVELSDCGGEIDQTAEEDPAGTTLAAACLWGGKAAVLMCRGLCPERLGLWWVPPASQRLLGCLQDTHQQHPGHRLGTGVLAW